MTHSKTYFKAHYKNAMDLYHDLHWLTSDGTILNIFDDADTVTVIWASK